MASAPSLLGIPLPLTPPPAPPAANYKELGVPHQTGTGPISMGSCSIHPLLLSTTKTEDPLDYTLTQAHADQIPRSMTPLPNAKHDRLMTETYSGSLGYLMNPAPTASTRPPRTTSTTLILQDITITLVLSNSKNQKTVKFDQPSTPNSLSTPPPSLGSSLISHVTPLSLEEITQQASPPFQQQRELNIQHRGNPRLQFSSSRSGDRIEGLRVLPGCQDDRGPRCCGGPYDDRGAFISKAERHAEKELTDPQRDGGLVSGQPGPRSTPLQYECHFNIKAFWMQEVGVGAERLDYPAKDQRSRSPELKVQPAVSQWQIQMLVTGLNSTQMCPAGRGAPQTPRHRDFCSTEKMDEVSQLPPRIRR
ncbi:unnamed protein product [Pleuronectes platessa]|uniref:Uncharacterized protein n=1 Tax=Pleuronectes platessa TaxID=8262 RepID=A0A9N7Z9E8_PLEPL|nr:unnamed protein product [Pleuronectes platessa]